MSTEIQKSLSASDCPACWEELGDRRVPYSLTCGHTLCIDCIKRLASNSPTFSCPLCREVVPLRSVKRNFMLHQLISQLKGSSTHSFNPALTTSFDSIKLENLLDRGASGEVHRGVWQDNDVAVKIFASGQVTPEITDSFRREVCVMNSLRHPNVVLLLAACPNPPKLAIVMEYVGGGSLYSHLYISKTPLELQDKVKLLIDVGRGLQYLHSINILHRDLKSKNVLLTSSPPNCQAKLCDFGLARMRLESATMTGNIGTVHWTAPEVLNCARYHFAADVYGLGMVIYEMIARTLPFSGLPPPTVIVAVLLRKEKPKIPPGCNEELSTLVNQCLAWEADERPSISAVLKQLYSLLEPTDTHSGTDNENSVLFNHTDSLGHVVFEVDLDETDIDTDLLKFLLENQDEDSSNAVIVESEANNMEGPNEFDESLKTTSSKLKHTHQTLSKKSSPTNKTIDDGGGIFTKNELRGFSVLTQQPSYGPHYSAHSSPMNDPLVQTPSWQQGGPARSQQMPGYEHLPQPHYRQHVPHPLSSEYGMPLNENFGRYRLESGGLMNFAEGMDNEYLRSVSSGTQSTEEGDFELAQALMKEEEEKLIKNDYKLASQLQHEYDETNAPSVPTPTLPPRKPPPPPTLLPLAQLPIMPTQKQLLMSQVTTVGRLKKLKHVVPKEKRGFKPGRVVGGVTSENSIYTVQNEIRNFHKKMLTPVIIKEPDPPFPVGRVVEIKPYHYVKKMVKRINSQVEGYDKKLLRHVSYKEKTALPTAKDIEIEKSESDKAISTPESSLVTSKIEGIEEFQESKERSESATETQKKNTDLLNIPDIEYEEASEEFTSSITNAPDNDTSLTGSQSNPEIFLPSEEVADDKDPKKSYSSELFDQFKGGKKGNKGKKKTPTKSQEIPDVYSRLSKSTKLSTKQPTANVTSVALSKQKKMHSKGDDSPLDLVANLDGGSTFPKSKGKKTTVSGSTASSHVTTVHGGSSKMPTNHMISSAELVDTKHSFSEPILTKAPSVSLATESDVPSVPKGKKSKKVFAHTVHNKSKK